MGQFAGKQSGFHPSKYGQELMFRPFLFEARYWQWWNNSLQLWSAFHRRSLSPETSFPWTHFFCDYKEITIEDLRKIKKDRLRLEYYKMKLDRFLKVRILVN